VERPRGQPRRDDTLYLATADAAEMMVSLTRSNYRGFAAAEHDHPRLRQQGRPPTAFGVMCRTMQPQGNMQLATRLFAKGQNPRAGIDAPRWRVEGDRVMMEADWPPEFRVVSARP
jgi:gamma-glutamyltranspeptidase/glutathione hydrolase